MPVNAPAEYFAAENRFQSAKSREERIAALEEMIRLLPKHHGSEQMHAQLKSKLAKLKKEAPAGRKGARKAGIAKEGEAQVCLIGLTNSGKSALIAALTQARPQVSHHPYTTTRPEVGMLDYRGVKIQLVEIPATFEPEYLSMVRSSDAVAVVARNPEELKQTEKILADNFVRIKSVAVNPWKESAAEIKERIWRLLGFIITYSKKTGTPMALPRGATVRDFAERIHKDFVRNFRFARLLRSGMAKQVGLDYVLEDGDVVDIHTK
ncbi:MAG: TGS domain-containing protein [Candidatus Aenigmarchaeota archaeon]|nr:TGS domain-containing protein [Candidatus Aenigmarchaeota archaeon]